MLCDIIINKIKEHPDMEVVGEVGCREELAEMADKTLADTVIIGCEPSDLPNIGERLFARHPNIKIVALAEHGRKNILYELAPRNLAIGELSPDELLNTVKQAVAQSISRQ